MTLLFLKRLNDTFEENAEKLIKKGMNKKEATVNEDIIFIFLKMLMVNIIFNCRKHRRKNR